MGQNALNKAMPFVVVAMMAVVCLAMTPTAKASVTWGEACTYASANKTAMNTSKTAYSTAKMSADTGYANAISAGSGSPLDLTDINDNAVSGDYSTYNQSHVNDFMDKYELYDSDMTDGEVARNSGTGGGATAEALGDAAWMNAQWKYSAYLFTQSSIDYSAAVAYMDSAGDYYSTAKSQYDSAKTLLNSASGYFADAITEADGCWTDYNNGNW